MIRRRAQDASASDPSLSDLAADRRKQLYRRRQNYILTVDGSLADSGCSDGIESERLQRLNVYVQLSELSSAVCFHRQA